MDTAPRIVREKEHAAEPATTEQALDAMELAGHDFHLFVDAWTGLPSVVYRRATPGFGVIRPV